MNAPRPGFPASLCPPASPARALTAPAEPPLDASLGRSGGGRSGDGAPELQARAASPPACTQGVATVVRPCADGGWWLRVDAREFTAIQAASCLLTPAVGDQVWMAADSGSAAFILAVLVQARPGRATLTVDGDLELEARGGKIRIKGDAGVALETPATLDLRARELVAQAERARFSFTELRALAREVFASFQRVTHVGKLLELLVDKVTQRSRHSVRAISGVDLTQAGTIDQRSEGDLLISAERALINGKELVKMDGAQIHLG